MSNINIYQINQLILAASKKVNEVRSRWADLSGDTFGATSSEPWHDEFDSAIARLESLQSSFQNFCTKIAEATKMLENAEDIKRVELVMASMDLKLGPTHNGAVS